MAEGAVAMSAIVIAVLLVVLHAVAERLQIFNIQVWSDDDHRFVVKCVSMVQWITDAADEDDDLLHLEEHCSASDASGAEDGMVRRRMEL